MRAETCTVVIKGAIEKGGSFWGNEDVLKLIVVTSAQHHEYTKDNWNCTQNGGIVHKMGELYRM